MRKAAYIIRSTGTRQNGFGLFRDTQTDAGQNRNEGWLSINHPGGKLTQFWLLTLKKEDGGGDEWNGLSEAYRA